MSNVNTRPKPIDFSYSKKINTIVTPVQNDNYELPNTIIENPVVIKENTNTTGISTDNITNEVLDKIKNIGLNMTTTEAKLEIKEDNGNCLRLSDKKNNYADLKIYNNGILSIQPITTTILVGSNTLNNTLYPLTLLNNPKIPAENNLGVGINFDLKNNINSNKTFGSITVIGNNVTDKKENGILNINLMNNGKINNALSLTSEGVLYIKTRSYETSDERLKDVIKLTNIEDSYNKIMKIKLKDYTYKTEKMKIKYTGVIAQELKEIIPEAVSIQKNNDLDDCHSVSTKELLYHMIAAIQYISK